MTFGQKPLLGGKLIKEKKTFRKMYFHENNISFGKNDIRLRGDFIKDRINVCLYIRIRQTWGKFYNVQKGKISFFQIFLIKDDKNPPILIVSPPSNVHNF